MAPFDKVVASAAETLYGDERSRSNLDDDTAKLLLDWALARITAKANGAKDEVGAKKWAQDELARVRPVLTAVNGLAKKSGPFKLSEVVASVEPVLGSSKTFSREEMIKLSTLLADGVWQMRAAPQDAKG